MRIIQRICLASLLAALPALGHAEVVVAAGAKSPLAGLNKGQVSEVFMGKAKSVNGNPAKPIDYAGSPRDDFGNTVLGKSQDQLKAHYAKLQFTGLGGPPKEVGSIADAKKMAAEDPSVLIYLEKGQVDSSLKVVYP